MFFVHEPAPAPGCRYSTRERLGVLLVGLAIAGPPLTQQAWYLLSGLTGLPTRIGPWTATAAVTLMAVVAGYNGLSRLKTMGVLASKSIGTWFLVLVAAAAVGNKLYSGPLPVQKLLMQAAYTAPILAMMCFERYMRPNALRLWWLLSLVCLWALVPSFYWARVAQPETRLLIVAANGVVEVVTGVLLAIAFFKLHRSIVSAQQSPEATQSF